MNFIFLRQQSFFFLFRNYFFLQKIIYLQKSASLQYQELFFCEK